MDGQTIRMTREDLEKGRVEVTSKNGERYTLALQPADVHDPTELPTYLAGFRPFPFRGDEASKAILVDNDEDKYRTFSSNDAFRRVEVKASPSSAVPEVDPSSSLDTFKVVDRFIGSFVPLQTENQSGNAYRPRMAAAKRASWAIHLDREIDVWTLLGTNTNFAAGQRTAVTTAWDLSNSDPIHDIQTAIEKSAQPVTDVWMNQKLGHAFLRNDTVRDHMRQMLGDAAVGSAVTSVAMASKRNIDFVIPGFPPFHIVAGKVLNESTSALDYILGDVVVLMTVPDGQPTDGEDIATSYTFRRKGPSGTGFETREFFVEGRGPLGGTMVAVSQADIAVMTGNSCGGILTGVHS